MEPFTLDVFISKRFVQASLTHRVTCKQVAVSGTNSKDIKAAAKSRCDIPACLAVGRILAERASEADVVFRVSSFNLEGILLVLETCRDANDCAPGLNCCNYLLLTSANPFVLEVKLTYPLLLITFYNQEDTVTNQLRNGMRGLMLDMYDFQDDIWLCHSFQGRCYNITAFGPAIDTLREVEAFFTENPSKIVTIIIEDYVHAPKGLTRLFANAGLEKYWYPVSKMPKKDVHRILLIGHG